MSFPSTLIVERINENIDTVLRNVTAKAHRMFLDEIMSPDESGDAAPFLKTLFPGIKIASMTERSLTAAFGRNLDHLVTDVANAVHGNGIRNHTVSGSIPAATSSQIEGIVEGYTSGSGHGSPNTQAELASILPGVEIPGATETVFEKDDVFFVSKKDGVENHVEIKTPKPNYDQGRRAKRRVLRIHAARYPLKVKAFVAFPYNPNGLLGEYRWPTTPYFLDPARDIMLGKVFWNYLGAFDTTYDELLDCFYVVGRSRHQEIDKLLRSGL